MKLVTVYLLLSTGLAPVSAYSQVIGEEQAPKVVGVDGGELYRARYIIQRFFAKEKHPECYRVVFSIFEGNLAVEFIPKDRDPIIYNEDEEPPVAKPPCGVNVGYVLDRRGKILRHLYSR